jgi:hypothetical protein
MAMGQLRQGKDIIKRSAEPGGSRKGSSSYIQYISWKNDESKNIFFVTPIDEVPKVLMHNFVRKYVTDSNGVRKERWLTFMCRKDPAWRAESNNYCPLCDDIGHKATERFVAVAVEVVPVMEGKRVVGVKVAYREATDKDGNEVEYPVAGLVVQGPKFFGTLVAYDQKRDISELSWDITREGEGLKTQYVFFPIEGMPDLSEVESALPDLNVILEELGSQEKYDRDLEGVTAEDQPVQFGATNATSKKSENSVDLAFDVLKSSLETKKKEIAGAVESY